MATPPALPPIVQAVLTRRVPCAILATLLFEIVKVPVIGLPLHGLLLALFPLIFFGGGFSFAMQAAFLGTLATGVIHQSLYAACLFLIAYAAIPLIGAYTFLQVDGLRRSATFFAVCAAVGVMFTLSWMASEDQLSVLAFSQQFVDNWFEMTLKNAAVDALAREQITQSISQILPGMVAVIIWAAWSGHLLLARLFANRYGFFQGRVTPFAELRFGLGVLVLFCITLIAMLILEGSGHFYSLNLFLIMAALLVSQGLAVVHVSLRKFNYPALIWLLYFILLVQPMFCIIPMLIGVLDYWFDYRKLKTEEKDSGTDST